MPYDVDAAEDWLDNWAAGVSAQAERAATLSRRVAALTGSAESPDGSIRVTVGSSGQLAKLELDDPELARRVLAVMRRAQASLAGKVTAEVRDTVGADSETGRAVIHSFETRFPAADLSAGDLSARDLSARDLSAGDFSAGDFSAGDFSVREEDADDGR